MFNIPFIQYIIDTPVTPVVCLGFLLVACFICWWMFCDRLIEQCKSKGDHDNV